MESFALLDDSQAAVETPASRLYTGFCGEIRCTDPDRLEADWARVEAELAAGRHAVIVADYEWGVRLAGVTTAKPGGMLRVLLYATLQRLDGAGVAHWLAQQEGRDEPDAAGVAEWQASLERPAFDAAIEAIHAAIRAGETYQINFSYRLGGRVYGSPLALYRRLRAAQPVPFGALIRLPAPTGDGDAGYLLSCSPELFLRHRDGVLEARPMKGTAARRGDPAADAQAAGDLAADPKNRAENLMIVDLLRNDLGRIAETGSVQVPALFAVEPYATVLQMTSTVSARLAARHAFPAVLRALFPCGSITGAPKHRSMQLIDTLEDRPRGTYTGAVGWMDAPRAGHRCGDFCLSVAIRTLAVGAERDGRRTAELGVGAGIVIDSRAADEYAECQLKARFVTALDPGFQLIETMRAGPAGSGGAPGIPLLARHLARLAASAAALGFRYDDAQVRAALARHLATLAGGMHRVRLLLHKDGRIDVSGGPLPALPPGPVRVLLADAPIDGRDYLLRHKTTRRASYDAAIRAAEAAGAFDTLFFNHTGALTEGGRSNVFVRLDGQWLTPPVEAGVLPGVMRAALLDDPAWQAHEAALTRADLARAEAVVLCNALRGVLHVRFDQRG
ncbi:para-aminobenzoate synthase component I [Azoarcus olearius]|uniref:chorismate-binding protein n=1 Tax=Azoarcus sp. (strain BH72) TaxID=418699 RepID=UPI00080619FC|nr:chorismate-binding protein [Azoarcus olearius]ANQ83289.1 para-aminobenzoate synthase component I [Azoarcus olearius]